VNEKCSKNELKSFIDSKWVSQKSKKSRTRTNNHRDDFIWKHKDLPHQEIISLAKKELGIGIGYDDIFSILNRNKKRLH
jgi:hypothetical protein